MYDDLRLPYQEAVPCIELGGIILKNKLLPKSMVNLVLRSFNRHGLIAGATGSGKTKTMQVLAEQLSLAGVPSLVMDIKGDISGLSMPGEATKNLIDRGKSLDIPFTTRSFPVEMLTLNPQLSGVPLRATVSGFGALLFSRMLDLNDTQTGVTTILFEFSKDNQIPLITLEDFKTLLQYLQSPTGNAKIQAQYGSVSGASIGTIMRKIIELEAQDGDELFAEPAFNIMDLLRTNTKGEGIISILRLMDMQDKPKLFSTFMLKLLTDVYRQLPEVGDTDKPKLVLFIDEAHLIFNNASKALLNLLETIIKLIRSKGVGLIFCTQLPNDVPEKILSQLGLKIQHALRAFTAKDRKAMKLIAQNFPDSKYYKTEELLTSLGIGEALVSALDSTGKPTPLVECLIRAPESRMGVISDSEILAVVQGSSLYASYQYSKPTPSAAEVLQVGNPPSKAKGSGSSMITILSKNTLVRQVIRQFLRQLTNQLFKLFGGGRK
jgi:DNA helicase HerA-like ATPase